MFLMNLLNVFNGDYVKNNIFIELVQKKFKKKKRN